MRSFTKSLFGGLLFLLCCTVSSAVIAQTTTLAGGNTSTGNIGPGIINSSPSVSNAIASFSIVQSGSANLTSVAFTTTGTYTTSDITSFALYVNTNANSIIGSTAVSSGSVSAATAGTQTISLSTAYAMSSSVVTYYFFIVPTISSSAVTGHTIAVNSITSGNLSVSAGSVSGSAAATGTLTIVNPTITSTTGATRCNSGTLTLSATASAGATINWYSAATGGTILGTGTSFTTPSISTTTTYYAEAVQSATIQTGTLSDNTTNLAGPYNNNQRTDLQYFSSAYAAVINSVDIYPAATGNLLVTITDNSGYGITNGTPYAISSGVTITSTSNTVPVTIPLGFSVPAGATNYQLGGTTSGTAQIYRGNINSTTTASGGTYGPYPAAVDGFAQTGDAGGNASATGTTGAYSGLGGRCYFYNWNITLNAPGGGGRTAVVASIPTPTGVTATATPNPICSGSNLTLTGTATGATSYSWTGPGGTAINSPTSLSTSVTGVAPGNAGVYTLTATAGTCSVTATTAAVTVNPLPTPTFTTQPGTTVCPSVAVTYTTQSGQSSYTWTIPGTSGTDYSITSGGTSSNTVTLQWLTAGSKTVTVNYSTSGCAGAAAASNTVTVNAAPAVSSFSLPSASAACSGSPTTVTVNSATLVNGTYTVTYNLSGANSATGNTATLVFSGGTGTFNTSVLASAGSTTVTVTSLTNAIGCSASVSGGSITFTVNAGVAAIGGATTICIGSTTTLTDATASGTWSSSNTGVATIGSSTGFVTSVSPGTTTITYTIASGCSASVLFAVANASPSVYTVTGGGSYCAGGSGVHIGLNNSDLGGVYKVFNGSTLMATVTGTGSALDLGLFTTSGTYTVAVNPGTTCSASMSGSATVSVNALPTVYSVGGGGAYCSGGTGVNITLSSSTIGVNYQLFLGATAIGSAAVGTGSSISMGPVTTAGTYTVTATDATTSCTSNMFGSATVSINALPSLFSVTGGGNYCLGGSGVHIGLSGSVSGTTYQLLIGGSPTGVSLSGTGSALDFGLFTTTGTYTVLATTTITGCSTTMSGTAVIGINPLPTNFTVAVTGGGTYCLGGAGQTISLSGSQSGVDYQLVRGTTFVGAPVPGTGFGISFGAQTTAGSYTVMATNSATGCISNMSSSVSISTLPLPIVFSVTGGGGYCAGGTGVAIGLSGSVAGTTYSLYNGPTLVGAVSGTGGTVSFGSQLVAATYSVTATTTATGCTNNMAGTVGVTINPLPATTYTVTGGGTYCAGGAGMPVGLSGSATGINYQLYRGITAIGVPLAGTALALDFGVQTVAGSYSVVATDAITGCTSNMTGAVLISVNPQPISYTVTGGGGFCAGGTGRTVGLSASNTGINYQLWDGTGATVGGTIAGTGAAINFPAITTAGTYTVTATDGTTGCTNNMSGSATISVNALPAAYTVTVTGGGTYCAGGVGDTIGLSSSDPGINYQLYNGVTPVGGPIGTLVAGAPISFGQQTAAGAYTVVATDATTGCSNNMTGTVAISINPLPAVVPVTGGGNYCAGGTGVAVGLFSSVSGINYQLMRGVTLVGPAVPGTGTALNFGAQTVAGTYTVVATNAATGCTSNMSGSAVVGINALPALKTVGGGGSYCAGGTGFHVTLNGSTIGTSYQAYVNGLPSGAPKPGTNLALDFGLKTAAGTYQIVATNGTTGCLDTMTGSATIIINALPNLFNVTGGGTYCTGDTGVHVGLDNSDTATNYQLYKGATAIGAPLAGLGGVALDFGLQTAAGIYTVKATNAASCTDNMTGSATIGTYALPTVYNVTGGGNYCNGGTGVSVGLSSSDIGVDYQLMNSVGPVGLPMPGTGLALNFGLQTTADIYTVVATNTTTNCTNNMSGSATVGINPLPADFTVTGGGSYCAGDAGLDIGLSGSNTGIAYQLLNGVTVVGTPHAGTGAAIDFGLKTAAGTYSVMATNLLTSCSFTMSTTVNIAINPLPNPYVLSGGGSYCSGTGGLELILSGSDPATDYQLYMGTTPVGLPVPGSGSSISMGFQAAAGTYTVVATDGTSLCTNTMGSQTISINPLPTAYTVIGGGSYCAGNPGVHVRLSSSNTGINYQLMRGIIAVGSLAGTGLPLDFGPQTVAGTYTVVATNPVTGCVNNMTGSVAVVINPLPIIYPVSSTSSTYCAGGGGVHIWLNTSELGINYQLFNGSVPSRLPVPGTGADSLDFGFSFVPGSYRVVATNAATGCVDTMSNVVTIIILPLPTSYAVTGGGSYCAGGTGVNVGLAGSNSGISYQLMNGTTPVGGPVAGTGLPISFGQQTAGSYTVVATNPITTCTNVMSGTASVMLNPVPAVFAVTGGGNYCAGTAGSDVSLSSSAAGVNYQLYRGVTTPVGAPVAGTGSSINFGPQTIGSYTVIASNATSGCASNMGGSVLVGINAAPAAHAVTGGGNYCLGGSGVHVGISSSDAGINYQLYNGGVAVGHVYAGITGTSIDFGLQTTGGTYTVVATDATTGCTAIMPGTATVVVNPLPTAYSVVGGGNYCIGGAGVHVGLGNSNTGVDYTLYNSSSAAGTMPGTGSPIDFGAQTIGGTYTVIATNTTTGCSSNMTGSVTITVNPIVTPLVTISNGSDTICDGTVVTFIANGVHAGVSPLYQWTVNGVSSAVGSTYNYMPANGDVIGVTLTSSEACATPATATNSVAMTVDPNESPVVSVMASPGSVVCQGTTVTFSATPTYGGTLPGYTWVVNGLNSGTASTYSYIPANGDMVYCLMTSNYHCRLAGTATSSTINMEVDVPTLPIITIASNPGASIAAGQTETLTASVVHGGPAPSYQWYINGVIVPGATMPTFISSTLSNNDSVTCQVVSSGGCPGILGFNSVRIHVYGVGVSQVNNNGADIRLVPNPNKGAFTIKGTLGIPIAIGTNEEVSLEITDMVGQVIYHSKVQAQNGELNEHIELGRNLANGMYILNLRSGMENKVFHMVIEQ
jgi:hypothetical protein